MRLQKSVSDKHDIDAKHAEDAQNASAPGSPLKGPPAPDSDQKTFVCQRCEQTIPLFSRDEHDDWHFAKDLEEEQDGSSTQGPPPQLSSPTSKKDAVNGAHKDDQPPQYAPPAHPPPRNGASRTMSRRPHTNQVIEVARLRARDEVRRSPQA